MGGLVGVQACEVGARLLYGVAGAHTHASISATGFCLAGERSALTPSPAHLALHRLLCARRRQLQISRQFSASELEHVLAYSDGKDGLLADLHIVSGGWGRAFGWLQAQPAAGGGWCWVGWARQGRASFTCLSHFTAPPHTCLPA